MNTFMNNLSAMTNYTETANGALAHKTTGSKLYDMFAYAAAMRQRSDVDCINMFKMAFEENPEYAMKCLFWVRACRGLGAGERRYFRVVLNWLANNHPEAVLRNMDAIAVLGRYDDYYCLVGTKCEDAMFALLKHQFALDLGCKTPSLLGKWLKSTNTSSADSRKLGRTTAQAFGMTEKQYRKALSYLRTKINVLEKLMSEGRWAEISFDKIPGKAGLVYRNAFARHDVERAKAGAQTYEQFMNDDTSKIKTGGLTFPYEMVREVIKNCSYSGHKQWLDATQRKALEKYWTQQKDFFNGKPCKMLVCADTSSSMTWGEGGILPIDVAISLAMYCAERMGGPFKNKYISFSRNPQLIEINGVDFVDKVQRIYRTNLCENTDLIKTFELVREASLNARPEDRPDTIVVISDMQIDAGASCDDVLTEMEAERLRWESCGLVMPHLVYWNVNAVQETILDLGSNVSYVSGASPSLFESVLTGKTGYDLMMEVLNSDTFKNIY